jgi:hypothetical protein
MHTLVNGVPGSRRSTGAAERGHACFPRPFWVLVRNPFDPLRPHAIAPTIGTNAGSTPGRGLKLRQRTRGNWLALIQNLSAFATGDSVQHPGAQGLVLGSTEVGILPQKESRGRPRLLEEIQIL